MMVVSQAIVGISIGVHFEVSVELETLDDLRAGAGAFLELMGIPPRPIPAEFLTCVRFELFAFIDEFLLARAGTRLNQQVVVFTAAASLTFQAPLAFVPFLLPTVSFLPVYLQLEHGAREFTVDVHCFTNSSSYRFDILTDGINFKRAIERPETILSIDIRGMSPLCLVKIEVIEVVRLAEGISFKRAVERPTKILSGDFRVVSPLCIV
jgi:hypothetical protein